MEIRSELSGRSKSLGPGQPFADVSAKNIRMPRLVWPGRRSSWTIGPFGSPTACPESGFVYSLDAIPALDGNSRSRCQAPVLDPQFSIPVLNPLRADARTGANFALARFLLSRVKPPAWKGNAEK